MRLVIDLQCLHTSSRNRGIGRYSLSLLKSLSRQRADHEIIIVLNSLFHESVERVRSELVGILPAESICVVQLIDQISSLDVSHDARREAAELIREQFISSLNPDFVLICSLFEGLGDNVVTSIGRFSMNVPTATILYDLIPLINRDVYLANPVIGRWYEQKLSHLRRSHLLLAISESSRQEAIDWLNADPAAVINISCAADDQFFPAEVSPGDRLIFQRKHGLTRPFVMYTGGIDHRKNIERLIEAYAQLPKSIRSAHQLAIVCAVEPSDRTRLNSLAAESGLNDGDLVLTGYISEEDLVTCYRLCEVFIFPSWHEGFGLPVLEAMKCGRPALASNRSSLPEVVGLADALFDPLSTASIRDAIAKALTDNGFRRKLELHAVEQAKNFDWDRTGQRAWDAMVQAHEAYSQQVARRNPVGRRPRMAYFSPLPPASSGISDYSAELLPELARYYEIDVVVAQEFVSDTAVVADHPVRSVAWFKGNFKTYDRVLYHFGNSDFHSHMFDLLQDYPGAIVLHDFFLSGIVAHRDLTGELSGYWARELLYSEGWPAVMHRFQAARLAEAIYAYPCNLRVLQNALGIIVHAEYSRHLAQQFYGPDAGRDWHKIPLLRRRASEAGRGEARAALGFSNDDFVVCSFGLLGPTKMNDRLLSAWVASPLAKDPRCHLVFVGKNDAGGFGDNLAQIIATAACAGTVKITGWTDLPTFRQWLASADLAVQLRTLSRGETSAAVLDCMNAGLSTIVNSNGSMAELPADCVWLLPDNFADAELIEALSTLYRDTSRRASLGNRARAHVARHHDPRRCAEAYADAIEAIYARSEMGTFGLEKRLAEHGRNLASLDWPPLIKAMAGNTKLPFCKKRLMIDVSELDQREFGSDIHRVAHSILMQWLNNPPDGFIVEPIYAIVGQAGYRYARSFTSKLLGIDTSWCEDEIVEPINGDVFLGLDLKPSIVAEQLETFREWRRLGVTVRFVVYDLLPIVAPKFFPHGAQQVYQGWLENISQFDGVICLSRTVADEYYNWLEYFGPSRIKPLEIDCFNFGGDGEAGSDTHALPEPAQVLLEKLRRTPSLLSVGTIEPRKGYQQTLDAVEMLWAEGIDVNFVIVGEAGWMMDDFLEKLHNHPKLEKGLFWLQGVTDTFLHAVYDSCRCLVAASAGEGFGLPLIEAAHHNLPVLARDLPVFREVSGGSVDYFPDSEEPEVIASAVQKILGKPIDSSQAASVTFLTWAESANTLLVRMLREVPPYKQWMPDNGIRLRGNDPRLKSEVGVPDGGCIRTSGEQGFLCFGPYLPLRAGRWMIVASGDALKLDGTEYIDVVSAGGTQTHFHSRLSERGGKWHIEAAFDIDLQVANFEVRVRVSSKSILSLCSVRLRREEDLVKLSDAA